LVETPVGNGDGEVDSEDNNTNEDVGAALEVTEKNEVSVIMMDGDDERVISAVSVTEFNTDNDSLLDFDEETLDKDDDEKEGLFDGEADGFEEIEELPVNVAGVIDCCKLCVSISVDAVVKDKTALNEDNIVDEAVVNVLVLSDAEKEGSLEYEGDAEVDRLATSD